MKPCTILDLGDIEPIISNHFQMDATFWIRERLYNKVDKLFHFDKDLVLSIERIGTYKYAIHIIGSTKNIKELRNFTINAGSWMFDNTPCTCLVVFAAVSNKRLQRFVGLTGGKRVGILQDAGDKEDEIMYTYSIRDRKVLEERICHKYCQQ